MIGRVCKPSQEYVRQIENEIIRRRQQQIFDNKTGLHKNGQDQTLPYTSQPDIKKDPIAQLNSWPSTSVSVSSDNVQVSSRQSTCLMPGVQTVMPDVQNIMPGVETVIEYHESLSDSEYSTSDAVTFFPITEETVLTMASPSEVNYISSALSGVQSTGVIQDSTTPSYTQDITNSNRSGEPGIKQTANLVHSVQNIDTCTKIASEGLNTTTMPPGGLQTTYANVMPPDVTNQHTAPPDGSTRFYCSLCPKSFTKKGTLTSHMKLHTGQGLYRCVSGYQANQGFYTEAGQITKRVPV